MLAMNYSTSMPPQASYPPQPSHQQDHPQMQQVQQAPPFLHTRSTGSIAGPASAYSLQSQPPSSSSSPSPSQQQQEANGLLLAAGGSWHAPMVAMMTPVQQQQQQPAIGKRGRASIPHQQQQATLFPGHTAMTRTSATLDGSSDHGKLQQQQQQQQEQQQESSSKKRRPSSYVAPRTIPTTFTSVTGTLVGPGNSNLRRNLSFSRIDPYVSYAQTPSLYNFGSNHNTTSSSNNNNNPGDMDMDASTGSVVNMSNPTDGQNRVRSMSL